MTASLYQSRSPTGSLALAGMYLTLAAQFPPRNDRTQKSRARSTYFSSAKKSGHDNAVAAFAGN